MLRAKYRGCMEVLHSIFSAVASETMDWKQERISFIGHFVCSCNLYIALSFARFHGRLYNDEIPSG